MRLRVGSAVAVAIVASLASGAAARATTPFFQDEIFLAMMTEPPTFTFPECQDLPVSIVQGTSPPGLAAPVTAFACPVRSVSFEGVTFMSMVVRLEFRGGTIVATPGASLDDSGPGPPSFPAGDICVQDLVAGFPGDRDFLLVECTGPITQATGIFTGRTGFVHYHWLLIVPQFYWLDLPSFRVSFS